MAKKKAGQKSVGMTVVSIKTTTEFRDWLARVARSERLTTVQFIERSVVRHAKELGIQEPAPERNEGRAKP